MKKLSIYPLLVLLLIGLTSFDKHRDFAPLEVPVIDPCPENNESFTSGERITYDVFYKAAFIWVKAGSIEFNVKEEEDTYVISARGTTLPFYDKIYQVRDYYETVLDKETLLPRRFVRDIQEGDYKIYDRIDFDHSQRMAKTLRRKNGEETTLEGSYDACVQDMLSILYYVRGVDMRSYPVGTDIPVHVFHENKTFDLEVHYTDYKSQKKFKGHKRLPAFEFKPDLIKNYMISDDHNMSIWVSDDANHLPMEIETNLTVGKMKAVLSSWEGLRHPTRLD